MPMRKAAKLVERIPAGSEKGAATSLDAFALGPRPLPGFPPTHIPSELACADSRRAAVRARKKVGHATDFVWGSLLPSAPGIVGPPPPFSKVDPANTPGATLPLAERPPARCDPVPGRSATLSTAGGQVRTEHPDGRGVTLPSSGRRVRPGLSFPERPPPRGASPPVYRFVQVAGRDPVTTPRKVVGGKGPRKRALRRNTRLPLQQPARQTCRAS